MEKPRTSFKDPVARARPSCCEGRSDRGRARRKADDHRRVVTSRIRSDRQRCWGDRQKEKRDARTQTRFSSVCLFPITDSTSAPSYGSFARYGIPLDVVPAASKRRGFSVTTPDYSLDQELAAKTWGKDLESGGRAILPPTPHPKQHFVVACSCIHWSSLSCMLSELTPWHPPLQAGWACVACGPPVCVDAPE